LAVEPVIGNLPVIGHLKTEHRTGRNHLAHSAGDAINAVLAAVGYNFRLQPKWLALLCALITTLSADKPLVSASVSLSGLLHGRLLITCGRGP
jgi:hypothetical protein